MKRVLMAALGLALSGTVAFAQGDKMAAKTPAPKSKVADALMAKENALIDAVKAGNAKAFSTMVKPGSWSVDEQGYLRHHRVGQPWRDVARGLSPGVDGREALGDRIAISPCILGPVENRSGPSAPVQKASGGDSD